MPEQNPKSKKQETKSQVALGGESAREDVTATLPSPNLKDQARTGFEPAIFGLRDRRLTTWPPRLTAEQVLETLSGREVAQALAG